MKANYRFHPPEYALGETEKFYSDMEARGWRLKKRGAYLSKFAPTEPSAARYRVEIMVADILDQPVMPEEQIAVYEDCGWEYVTDRGSLYFFRAPQGSDAPEFYTDPRQQAEVLKKQTRRDRWGWGVTVLILALWGLMFWAMERDPNDFAAELLRSWVEHPAVFLLYGSFLLGGLVEAVYGDWSFRRLYRRLKKGVPMDHAPRGRGLLYRIPRWFFRGVMVLGALLLVVQLAGTRKYDLPETADGPYILLEDLGYTGKRIEDWVNHRPSRVEHTQNFLAEQWHVREFMGHGGEYNFSQLWLYMDAYRLSPLVDREKFAWALMEDAVMARSAEDFGTVEWPGLDAAWKTGMEVVAIRGDYVFYVEHLPQLYMDDGKLEAILTAIANLKI